jgi:hypothetical protein
MKQDQPSSFPTRSPFSAYAFISFIGGLIRRCSLLVLILWLCFAAAAVLVATAQSFWHHPDVQCFVVALKEDLAAIGSPIVDLDTEPPQQAKDMAKAQREENRARRKLAAELKGR